ncbi:MAG: DAK2 domain-containing protein, partial [Clostridia bacterium]|nr:DAK2 domain-containing protein [Clostridia bacterium]
TYAVRNTTMNGFKLKEGDIIGLNAKKILAKGTEIDATTLALIKAMKNSEHEMITLYYGEGVTEEDAAALAAKVTEAFPDCDVDYHFGGQPVYYYMVSLE